MNEASPFKILYVEDNEEDLEAFQRACKKSAIKNPLVIARNGAEALEILRGDDSTPALELPYLVLLDLNMPIMNGLEFLDNVRKDKHLKDTVIIVLTTSNYDKDRTATFDNNVAGYIVKSEVGEGFSNVIDMMNKSSKNILS